MSSTSIAPLAHIDEQGIVRVPEHARADVRRAILSFLDTTALSTGRETYYNKSEEQQAIEKAAHDAVFSVNRGLYAALLCLPGVSDRAVQIGLTRLIGSPHPGSDAGCFLTPQQEGRALNHLVGNLLEDAPQRVFKLFVAFYEGRIKTARAYRVILKTILGAGAALPWWSVKYRMKLRTALIHALGHRRASSLRSMTNELDPRSSGHAHAALWVSRYIEPCFGAQTYECINYILGGKRSYTNPLLAAAVAAHGDLSLGSMLPPEVLMGLRGTFHPQIPKANVYAMTQTSGSATEKQKMQTSRAAEKVGVKLEFNPNRMDLVSLYVYALEVDFTTEVRQAIARQARKVAATFPLRYEKIAILVDDSGSMFGTSQQKWRPLATALAMRDALAASAQSATCLTGSGESRPGELLRPSGDTSLAGALLRALQTEPEAIYVLSDGYENAPAGRFDEVLQQVRRLGIMTPVYQMSSVIAAEKTGVRALSSQVAAMPVARPEELGLGVIRAALEADVEQGIAGLLTIARPLLLGTTDESHSTESR